MVWLDARQMHLHLDISCIHGPYCGYSSYVFQKAVLTHTGMLPPQSMQPASHQHDQWDNPGHLTPSRDPKEPHGDIVFR